MRIGIQARFLRKPDTGIGQVTLAFVEELAQLPFASEHYVILFVEEMPTLSFALPPHWEIRVVTTWYRRDDLIREHLYERFSIPRALRQAGCEVFLSLYQAATVLPQSVRHVMLVHDLAPLYFPEYLGNWRKKWHYRKVIQGILKATQIVTISESTAKDIYKWLAIPVERVIVAALGVRKQFNQEPDTSEIASVLNRYDLKPGEYLYHGGGLEIRKNTARLLRAYASLIPRLGKSLPPLVISGKVHAESNPLATPVHTIVAQLEISSRVRILGFVPEEDLPSLYSGAQAFLYPSLFEGFGLPIVEAFSRGTPVLTSQGGATEEVAAGAACLVDPMSEESLAQGIERLVREENYRIELAHAGRKRSEIFSWIQFTETVAKFLVQ